MNPELRARLIETGARALLRSWYSRFPDATLDDLPDEDREDLYATAAAVVDALQPAQVGWMGPYGIITGGMDNDPAPNHRPVFRLGAAE